MSNTLPVRLMCIIRMMILFILFLPYPIWSESESWLSHLTLFVSFRIAPRWIWLKRTICLNVQSADCRVRKILRSTNPVTNPSNIRRKLRKGKKPKISVLKTRNCYSVFPTISILYKYLFEMNLFSNRWKLYSNITLSCRWRLGNFFHLSSFFRK